MEQNREKYSVSQFSVNSILADIERGEIAIPEIQRPFVWDGKKVKNLIDSLYKGYPTGYLIIWQNPDVKLKNGGNAIGKKVLIDGQQRVTALMTALLGKKVLTDDYEEKVFKIAFNPLAKEGEEQFAVQTPAHVKSSFWIPDISSVINGCSFTAVKEYVNKNPGVSEELVAQKLEALNKIKSYQFGAIILTPDLNISEVTDIFVRINSEGSRLNEADFAMSKIAADEKFGGNLMRKAIDYFCHLSVKPNFYDTISLVDRQFLESEYASKLSWLKNDFGDIYDPKYSDMLRVSFMHIFGRAKLGDLVNLLSGRDFINKVFREEIAEDSFRKLKQGVLNFMNEHNFNQFVLAIKSAGFVSPKLLNSDMTLDFAYTLYLLLQTNSNVAKTDIKRYVQKWFVLSTLTGRYVGSPETQMDSDLRAISEKGIEVVLKEVEDAELSEAFWNVGLVQKLETSSANSPYLNVYIAAQVHAGDRSLLSNSSKVSDLLTTMGDVHHIFPKAYLKKNGVINKTLFNQAGNFALLDTIVNISIGDRAPSDYFCMALKQCDENVLDKDKVGTITNKQEFYENLATNAIPVDVVNMGVEQYPEFLKQRRILMAEKIKLYYGKL